MNSAWCGRYWMLSNRLLGDRWRTTHVRHLRDMESERAAGDSG